MGRLLLLGMLAPAPLGLRDVAKSSCLSSRRRSYFLLFNESGTGFEASLVWTSVRRTDVRSMYARCCTLRGLGQCERRGLSRWLPVHQLSTT